MKGVYNMRPCVLRVSGLNSFVQEEVIDFSELIDRGLFGIFGPTGSGKSSILDAVTIALYGKIARDTKEFINKETEELFVYFQFKMGNDNTDYTVERKLKIKNDIGYLTSYARLAIRKNDELVEVFDGVNEINAEIEKIIGLNHEDFMRTVVLPQGKFSKFLKLTGKERRDMLERILKLEEFGEILMDKLRARKSRRSNELSQVETILANYKDVTQERLKHEVAALDDLMKQIKEKDGALKKKNKEYEKYKNIWEYQKELKVYNEQLTNLTDNDKKIKKLKERCEKTKNAISIKSEIERFDKYNNFFQQNMETLDGLEDTIEKLEEKQSILTKEYEDALALRDKEIPELTKIKERISSAKKLYDDNQNIEKSITKFRKELKKYQDKENELQEQLENLNTSIAENTSIIKEKDDKLEKLKIKVDYRQKIDSGLSIEKEYNKTSDQLQEIKSELEEKKKEVDRLKSQYKEKEEKLKIAEGSIIYKYQKNIAEKKGELKNAIERKEKLENDIKKKEKRLEKLSNEVEEIRTKNQAAILAGKIEEGAPCPVCGSVEHPHIAENINIDIEEYLQNIKEIKDQLEELKKDRNNIDLSIGVMENEISRMDKEKEEFISLLKNKLSVLEDYIEESSQKMDILKSLVRENREDMIELSSTIQNQKNNLETLEKRKSEKLAENKELSDTYSKLLAEYSIESFAAESKEINKKDRERESLETFRADLKKKLEENIRKKDKLSTELTDMEKITAELSHKLETVEEKHNINKEEISKLIGGNEPDQYLKEVEEKEKKLQKDAKDKKDESEKLNNTLNEKKSNYKSIKTRIDDIKQEIAASKEILENKTGEYEIVNIEQARKLLTDKDMIEKWDEEINKHEERKKVLLNNIARINKELQGERVSEEEWNKLITVKEKLENDLSTLNQQIGSQKEVIKTSKKELKIKNEHLEQKKKIEHKLSLINAIDKLIKGKSFVEFVAIRQLRYIAREASRRLLEITNNRYQLELDNQGEFVICDNYLGGVKRGCNTLSGGETFLSSLALALALSSQIQLKGSSTMEFFFLDEGFGTLDENLLDIVMSSLEKLPNENLSVGIISHVKELRNRVPVKLMVEPAESGLHGSKVKIEYS